MTTKRSLESTVPATKPGLGVPMAREKVVVVSLRMTPGLKAAVDKAASASNLGLMEWIRGVLALAANQGAFAPRRGGGHGRRRKD